MVRTPNLDALAAEGVLFARHYANAAPCGPSRASLHTGMYLQNHRSVHQRHAARRAPHQLGARGARARLRPGAVRLHRHQPSTRAATPDDDPWLRTYEGPLPGIRPIVHLDGQPTPWTDWLRAKGYDAAGQRPQRPMAGASPGPTARTARPQPRPLACPRRGRRHRLPDRPADRLPEGAREGPVRRPPVAAAPAPAVRGARAVQRAVRSRPHVPGFSARGQRRRGGAPASLAGLAAGAHAVPRPRRRAAAAAAEGGLLRPDEPGGRRDRPADRRSCDESGPGRRHADRSSPPTTASSSATTG